MTHDVIVTFTGRPAEEIITEGGSQAWALNAPNARRCSYLVCTRNRSHQEITGGHEPHGSAFLVGKVSTIEPAPDNQGRFIVRFSEYAILDKPIESVWPGHRNPVWYTKSLTDLRIDESTLKWHPVGEMQAEITPKKFTEAEALPPRLSIKEAKRALALTFNVLPENIEIIIKG